MSTAILTTAIGGGAAHAAARRVYHALMQASPAGTYTVRPGDTLSGIAASHGISLAAIFAANNMNMATIIYPGQKIKVGPAAATTPKPLPKPATKPATVTTHTVQPGDTLGGIAARHGVSLAAVLEANGMTVRTIIYPGQNIRLAAAATPATPATPAATAKPAAKPATPAATKTYIVKGGDTLSRIAANHGVSLSAPPSRDGR
jgi:LysM repeat protein